MTPEVMKTPSAVEATVRGEIDMQIATAKKYPRDVALSVGKARDLMTLDQRTAEDCIYALPRDGKQIEGPSVRAAEILASSWGNLRVAARVLEEGERTVTCSAVCHDLESNVAVSVEVKRRITNKYGKRYSDDMIITTSNAGCSIAFRNAILKVIPKALWKPAFDGAYTMAKSGGGVPLHQRRRSSVDWFNRKGVSEAQLLKKLGVEHVAKIGEEELVTLRGIANAIQEETLTVEEVFGEAAPPPAPEPMKEETKWEAKDDAKKPDAGATKSGIDTSRQTGETSEDIAPSVESSSKNQPAPPKSTGGLSSSTSHPASLPPPPPPLGLPPVEEGPNQDWEEWLAVSQHLPEAALKEIENTQLKMRVTKDMPRPKLRRAVQRAIHHLPSGRKILDDLRT